MFTRNRAGMHPATAPEITDNGPATAEFAHPADTFPVSLWPVDLDTGTQLWPARAEGAPLLYVEWAILLPTGVLWSHSASVRPEIRGAADDVPALYATRGAAEVERAALIQRVCGIYGADIRHYRPAIVYRPVSVDTRGREHRGEWVAADTDTVREAVREEVAL